MSTEYEYKGKLIRIDVEPTPGGNWCFYLQIQDPPPGVFRAQMAYLSGHDFPEEGSVSNYAKEIAERQIDTPQTVTTMA